MINYSFAQLFDIKNLVKVTLAPQVWNRIRQIGINLRRRGVRARRKFCEIKFKQTKINKQNLISISRTNTKSTFELKFGTVNAMSLNNKSLSILETVLDHKLDILLITETWINDEKADVLGDLNSNGYTFKNFPRKDCRGGGIGLLSSDYLQMNNPSHYSSTSFQYITCTIGSSQHSCTITLLGCYYPTPFQNQHCQWCCFHRPIWHTARGDHIWCWKSNHIGWHEYTSQQTRWGHTL